MLPGRRSVAMAALAVALAGTLAGCGSEPALVDSTTQPVPTVTTAATATTRPGPTAAPGTRPIPTGTGKVPLTTGQTGPAGKPLTFRGLTIRPHAGWRARAATMSRW